MTSTTYKKRVATVEAIEFKNLLSQVPDVAALISSQAYQVDVGKSEATFVLADGSSLSVKQGQVVSLSSGSVVVSDPAEFFAIYEAV